MSLAHDRRVTELLNTANRYLEQYRQEKAQKLERDRLLRECRDLFRFYEEHHRAKISEQGRPEKAERNKQIADRIDALTSERADS